MRPSELTPAWLTGALATAGITTPVTSTSTERVGTGQMGTSYRVQLGYADAERARTEGAPSSVVAKMAAGPPEGRATIAEGYRNEIGFYTGLAGTVAVRTPRCWYAAITDDGTCFTLLLEDLAPATPGVQTTGLTVEQAADAVQNLAGLHGPRWNDPSLLEGPRLARHDEGAAEFVAEVLRGAIPTFVDRFGAWLGSDDEDTLRDVPNHLAAW